MKLALCFFGISKYEYEYEPWTYKNKYRIVDYNKSYDNYKKYIFDFFENKGYNIDVYFTTNILNDYDKREICEKYKPVKCNFIKTNPDNLISKNEKLNNVIDLLIESKNNYDSVLITRFDLLFQKDFNESNIILDKFNLVSILENPNYICDNFYLFPYKYLSDFSKIIKKSMNKCLHFIKDDIDNINGIEFVNYIYSEYTSCSNLSFYKIVRNVI